MINKKAFIRRITLAAYFLAAFLVFLFFLFPFDRIKSRIETEVRARTSLELNISHVSPRFINWFVLNDVVLSNRSGKVLFESPSVNTRVSLFGLITRNFSLSLSAAAYGGELLIKLKQGTKQQSLIVDANTLDIASYPILKDAGLELSGKLGGNFEMTGDSGRGRLWLKSFAWRGLKIKGFPMPDLDFEQGWIEGEVKADRLTVKKLEMEGRELKIKVTGDLVLRENGALNVAVKLKPSEKLSHEQTGLLSLLKNRDAEGFYQFSLGGTLSEPLPRL